MTNMIHMLNDSKREASGRALVTTNVLAALLSGASSVLATNNPSLLVNGDVTPIVEFYVQAYLARALPIGAVLITMLATGRHAGLRPLLLIAGLVQAGDAVIGALHAQPGMIAGSTVGAVIHLGSAWLLGRTRRVRGLRT
jgi:hypothetical protein